MSVECSKCRGNFNSFVFLSKLALTNKGILEKKVKYSSWKVFKSIYICACHIGSESIQETDK